MTAFTRALDEATEDMKRDITATVNALLYGAGPPPLAHIHTETGAQFRAYAWNGEPCTREQFLERSSRIKEQLSNFPIIDDIPKGTNMQRLPSLSDDVIAALRALPEPPVTITDPLQGYLYKLRGTLTFAPKLAAGLMYRYVSSDASYRVVKTNKTTTWIERLSANPAGPAGSIIPEDTDATIDDFEQGRCFVIEAS